MTSPDSPHKSSETSNQAERVALRLLLTMADTTWRMVVPTGVLATLAILADLRWHTKPWLTLASLPVGLGLSVLLIRQQLRMGAS
ncbi:MAG TPA: AtpZ/AtpI family protein [Candidatus Saccharimonadia bacterium]|nr:AtpZ/AtpI family protein [Candidatus Saccharimonadia bacterium]